MANRTGFGDSSATRGLDLTQGYRDANPYFDKAFVKRQIEPYKDAGLSQNLGDLARKSDQQLYDTAAKAVIKLAAPPKTQTPTPTPTPTPRPTPTPSPSPKPTLTARQRANRLYAKGLTPKQIAARLGISVAKARLFLGIGAPKVVTPPRTSPQQTLPPSRYL